MGFLDIFRKKNDVIKSVSSSIATTNKLLNNQTKALISSEIEYEQGLKLLNGIPPQFDLAREYFQKAHNQGNKLAKDAAEVIGLNKPTEVNATNYFDLFSKSVELYLKDKNAIGNLVYLITYDLKFFIFNTSSNPVWYASRFVDYEIYCMRNYGNDEIMAVHDNSCLKDWELSFEIDWMNGEISSHSDYLNEKVFPHIMALSNGKLNMFRGDMAVLRAAVVSEIINNYL